jgi:hypothetical protein
MKRRRSLLSLAIECENWEAASVLLLYGAIEVTKRIPRETLEEMISVLEAEEARPHRPPARKPRRAHR